MKKAKKIIAVLATVVVGFLVATIAIVNLISGETYKRLIVSAVSDATGRALVIEGPVDLTLTTSLAFSATGIGLANADWGIRPEMLRIEKLDGRIALLPLLRGVLDVDVTVVKPRAAIEAGTDGRSNWALGSEEKAPADDQKGGGLGVRPGTIHLTIAGAKVTVHGASGGNPIEAAVDHLAVDTDGKEARLSMAGAYNAVPLTIEGTVNDTGRLLHRQAAALKLNGRFGQTTVSVDGMLALPLTMPRLNLKVVAATPTLAEIAPVVGGAIPDVGPIALAGTLTAAKNGRPVLRDLKADLNWELMQATVTGTIGDLAALSGIDLKAVVSTDDLAEALSQLGMPVDFPLPTSVTVSGDITGSGADLALSRVEGTVRDPGTDATVRGDVRHLLTFDGVDAQVTFATDSLARFAKYAGTALPELGPLKASTRFVVADNRYRLADTDIQLDTDEMQARLTGAVGDLMRFQEIEARLEGTLASLSALNGLLPNDLPDSGPVTVDGRLTAGSEPAGPMTVALTAGTAGLSVGIDGEIDSLQPLKGIDMAVWVKADTLERIGTLAAVETALQDPVDLSARIRARDGGLEVPELRLQLGPTELTARAEIGRHPGPDGRPRVNGKVHFGDLDLTRLTAVGSETKDPTAGEPTLEAGGEAGSKPDADVSAPEQPRPGKEKRARVFSDKPLAWDRLLAFDADIQVTGERLKTFEFLLEDIDTHLTVANGRLQLDPFDARVGEGRFEGGIAIDAAADVPTVSVAMDMDDASFYNFGGRVDVAVDLAGEGRSVADLMAGLDGHLVLGVKDAELKASLMTHFGGSLLRSLNPLAGEKETTHLDCAVIGAVIEDGSVNMKRKIAAQMTDITWFGSGRIDLKTEEIDFGVHSKARRGIGIGGLAKLVQVGGTLAKPKIRLDPTDVAVHYGKYMAFMATGGLSLALEALWNLGLANSDVCSRIIDRVEKTATSRETEGRPTNEERTAPVDGTP